MGWGVVVEVTPKVKREQLSVCEPRDDRAVSFVRFHYPLFVGRGVYPFFSLPLRDDGRAESSSTRP